MGIETISVAINQSQRDVTASFFLFFSFWVLPRKVICCSIQCSLKKIWWKEIWPLSYMKSPPFLPIGWIRQDVFLFFWWMVVTFKILLFVFAFHLEMDIMKKIASNKDVCKGLPDLTWNSPSCDLTRMCSLLNTVFFLDKAHALVKLTVHLHFPLTCHDICPSPPCISDKTLVFNFHLNVPSWLRALPRQVNCSLVCD